MERVDQVHQVLRRAVSAGGREVAGGLVAPRREERVLGDRQELDVSKTHVAAIVGELRAEVAIAQRMIRWVCRAHPRAEMDLIDAHGRILRAPGLSGLHPLCIVPLVGEVPGYCRGLGRDLAGEGEGVGLLGGESAGEAMWYL